MKRALLLSGGMDSVAIAYWKRPDLAITIDYGQRPAAGEVRAATAVCAALGIQHQVICVDIASLGSGDLSDRPHAEGAPASEWWPYRNQFLLTVAAMRCHSESATRLMIGALRTDGFHADGTPGFIEQINSLFALQEGELKVEAPGIEFDAVELVRASKIPQEVLAWSHSCHVSEYACGTCRGCHKHYNAMESLYGYSY
ncbi:MAG: 7-cyano-7-deazaguanine synthase [Hyphomonas sp.]